MPSSQAEADDYSKLLEKYQGVELFEKVTTLSIEKKETARSNRCPSCWHDATSRCICPLIAPVATETLHLPIQVIVLMHHKEYLSAGDDAKLLLRMLPDNSKLFVFGRTGDWELFEEECAIDPVHTLTLWPTEGALTIQEYLNNHLPDESPWRQQQQQRKEAMNNNHNATKVEQPSASESQPLPVLRVIVLDGVYSHARNMFSAMKKRLPQQPPFIALHPDTVSVYHRAQKTYATSSRTTVLQSKDPKALHICTVEAYALLLKELGESSHITDRLVDAVQVNNDALVHSIHVRPESGMPNSTSSGAAKRRRRKNEARAQAQEEEVMGK